jgi:polyhydroxyalkanoate synthesis regulator phasin
VSQNIDVERELNALRERVRRSPAPASDADLTSLQKAIANLNANWHISATLPPPAPNAPLTWRVVYFGKRVVRRGMVELLNTIVQQQNSFNLQVARALTELAAQETRVQEIERRLAEMEKRLGTRD